MSEERRGENGAKSADATVANRVAFWDNARGLLILSVVYGHLVESTMWNSKGLYNSFLLIYSFHMPLFVFIAGYMTSDELSVRQFKRNLSTLIAPYLVFETFYSFWDHWTRGTSKLVFSYATPFWPLWFLVSLFAWRVLLPYVKRLRGALIWLLAISVGFCASGEVNGFGWSMSRTIYFFPFFFAGHALRGKPVVEWLTSRKARVLGALVFGLVCTVVALRIYTIRREWFFGVHNTWDLGYRSMGDALRRLPVYALSGAMGSAFLALIPRRRIPLICGWGERSLAIYLFHSAFHFLALGRKWYDYLPYAGPAKGAMVLAVSLLICALLGSTLWTRLTRWMLSPPVDWLFTADDDDASFARR